MKGNRAGSQTPSKFLLISILSHIALLFILVSTGVLKADLTFNKDSKEAIDPETRAKLQNLRKAEKRQKKKARLAKKDAELLKKTAERKIQKELKKRLIRMVKIRDAMRNEELEKLDVIKKRPDDKKPADFNDTTAATDNNENPFEDLNLEKLLTQKPEDTNTEDLYESIRSLESQIADDSQDKNAGEYAAEQDVSYPKAQEVVGDASEETKSFDEVAKGNSDSKTADADPSDSNLAEGQPEGDAVNPTDKTPKTLAELGEYREFLNKLNQESKSLESSALAKIGVLGENEAFLESLTQKKKAGSGSGSGKGEGQQGTGSNDDILSGSSINVRGAKSKTHYGRVLSAEQVLAQALPGRRITADSIRKGWLYINTWYIIGPWDVNTDRKINKKRFAVPHPPEFGIDFDAVYYDGVKGRKGVIVTSSDPRSTTGRSVTLDGVLRWKFMQSESLHNKMPVTDKSGIYYAYTELYFDESREMLVAIGTDDSGKLWVNGESLWEDRSTEWGKYYIDEHIAKIKFRKGVNKILFRLENYGGAGGFSLMLCPPNSVKLPK